MKKILHLIITALVMVLGTVSANAADYVFKYDKAGEQLTLTWADGTEIAPTGIGAATLTGYTGYFSLAPSNSADDFFGTNNQLRAYVALPDGDYTLNIPAGAYTINGKDCEAITETFTVGESYNFDGEKWSETVFTAGKENVTFPYTINTEGVILSTKNEGNFEFNTNIYDEKEIDWLMGCKIIITAKDNISAIVFEAAQGSNLQNCSADKGTWSNGTWTGGLMKGESLTLTALETMLIKGITIYYNGETIAENSDDIKGVISVIWPKENEHIEKIVDGGLMAKFTTTKHYSQITVELRNVNSVYHNLYDLPVRYMDDVNAGEVECKTSTPGDKDPGKNEPWYTFNGDAYELIIKGYVNYWDNEYDAIATVPVVGTGIEHEKMSDAKLIKITPETATEISMDIPFAQLTTTRDNEVIVEFDAPMSKVNAVRQGSLMAGMTALSLVTTPYDGSNDKIWSITVPKAELEDAEGSYEFELTAYDKEGHALNLNPNRADHALAVKFDVTTKEIDPSVVRTLGTPAFSIASGTENVPVSTTAVAFTFPEAQGYDADIIVKVDAVLACMDMSTPQYITVDGTIGEGVSIPVSLFKDKGYSLMVQSIGLYEKIIQYDEINNENTESLKPIGTYNTQYSTIFYTEGEGGGGDESPVKTVVSKIVDYAAFLKFSGIENVLTEINSDSYLHVGTVFVNGEASFYMADDVYGEDVLNDLRVTAWGDIKEGNNTIVIPANTIEIGEFPFGAWNPTIKFTNDNDITINFTVENGEIISGISNIMLDSAAGNRIYNISGQQIQSAKGIVIINGKKYSVK